MVRNKILGVAILAAFGLSIADVAQAGTFVNVDAAALPEGMAVGPPGAFGGTFEGTVDAVFPTAAVLDGITYAAEMFQGTGITIPDNGGDTTKGSYAVVSYTIDGNITKDFRLTYTLDNGAQFDGPPILSISGGAGSGSGTQFDCTTPASCKLEDGGSGNNFVTYTITANTNNLVQNDVIALAYRLKNTGALGTPGQKIQMTAKLETYPLAIKVAPSRTIGVAQSKAGVGDIKILPEEGGTVKISVSSGQTEFIGENPAGGAGAYVSTDEVILGYIEINQVTGVKSRDGINNWKIGTGEGLVVEGDTTTLVISEGQFAAAASGSNGQVYLVGDNSGLIPAVTGSIAADVVEVDGKWIATWQLANTTLQNMATDAGNQIDVMLKMKVDGSTAINVTENPPVATLNIDFDEDFMEDITDVSAELRRFRLDGTVCTLYNIPGSSAPDSINIRITNDTNSAGGITIGMWGQDGTELIPAGTLLLGDGATGTQDVLEPYATWHISAAELETFSGGAWTGRAIATLSSTISKLEMFALLRHKATGINSSISGGASGNACPDD